MQVVIGNDGTPMAVPMRAGPRRAPAARRARGGGGLPPVREARSGHRDYQRGYERRRDGGGGGGQGFINRMAQPKAVRGPDDNVPERRAWGGGPGKAGGGGPARRGGGGGLQSGQYQRRREAIRREPAYDRGPDYGPDYGGGRAAHDWQAPRHQAQRHQAPRYAVPVRGGGAGGSGGRGRGEPGRLGELRRQQQGQQVQLRQLREEQNVQQRELHSIHQDEMAELSRRQSWQQELTTSLEQLEAQVAATSEAIMDEIEAARDEIMQIAGGNGQLPPLQRSGGKGGSPVFEDDEEEVALMERRAEAEDQAARLEELQGEVGQIRAEVAAARTTGGKLPPVGGKAARRGRQAVGRNSPGGMVRKAAGRRAESTEDELIRMADGEEGRLLEEEEEDIRAGRQPRSKASPPWRRDSHDGGHEEYEGEPRVAKGAKAGSPKAKGPVKRAKGSIIGELRKAGLAAGLPDTIDEDDGEGKQYNQSMKKREKREKRRDDRRGDDRREKRWDEQGDGRRERHDRDHDRKSRMPPPLVVQQDEEADEYEEHEQLGRSISWDESTITPGNERVAAKQSPKETRTRRKPKRGSVSVGVVALVQDPMGSDEGFSSGGDSIPGESQKEKLKRLRATAILTREYIANSMGFGEVDEHKVVPAYAMALKRSKGDKEKERLEAQYGDVTSTLSRSSKLRALREDKAARRQRNASHG